MSPGEIRLAKFTRREFREARRAGHFHTAVVVTASHEQHSEHLPMDFDLAAASHIAGEAARALYPQVLVTAPMAVGLSEHHMVHPGTVSAKPGGWLAVLFDAVESLARHGIRNILILNGHGGNSAPIRASFDQWRFFFKLQNPELNLHFASYWDLIPPALLHEHMSTQAIPGHAKEFETSIALALDPEIVRRKALREHDDPDPLAATAEKGRLFVDEAVRRTAEYLRAMIAGANPLPEVRHFP